MQERACRKRAVFPRKGGDFPRKMTENACKKAEICGILAQAMDQIRLMQIA
jgi:hypothetical protein